MRIESENEFMKGKLKEIVGEEEEIKMKKGSEDIIVQMMEIKEKNEKKGEMVKIEREMKKEGIFMEEMRGRGNMGELRESIIKEEIEMKGGEQKRVMKFEDVRDVGRIIKREGLEMNVKEVEKIKVSYDQILKMMEEMREMGMKNIMKGRQRKKVQKRILMSDEEIYEESF